MRSRIRSPTTPARSTSSSSSKTSSTASAAASATGLPMYVPPIAPTCGASMISARPITPDSGRPAAIDFATVIRSARHRSAPSRTCAPCGRSRSAPRPRRGRCRGGRRCARSPSTNAGGAGMKPPSPSCGSNTIAATCSAATCVRACARAVPARRSRGDAAVGVRERRAVDLGRERPEPGLVRMRLGRHRHRQQRAAVEAALERDHGGAARVQPRDLDGVLDGLGAGLKNAARVGPAIGASAPSRSASST